jgi:hypothetical protein
MFKTILLFSSLAIMALSCDVRKKDRQAEGLDVAVKTTVEEKDPTTVQIIDSVYNFGKVTDGEIVEFSFRFKNTGNKPLVIEKTTASCGCTVPEKPEQPILPGEIGFIKVKFDSKGRVGVAKKTVAVLSNANPGFPDLLLTGEVTAAGE